MSNDRHNGARVPWVIGMQSDAVREATERLQRAHKKQPPPEEQLRAKPEETQIGYEDGAVLVVYDKPITYARMTPEAAVEMAAHLLGNAMAAGFPAQLQIVEVAPQQLDDGDIVDAEVKPPKG